MTVYSKLGASNAVTANAALTLNISDITTPLFGTSAISFVKITNSSNVDHINFSFRTSAVLSGDNNPVVVPPLATEFIQVAETNNTGNVYFYVSSANAVVGYITPVTIVG